MRAGSREHGSHVAMLTPRTPLQLGRPSRVQRYSLSMHRAMEEDSLMTRYDDDVRPGFVSTSPAFMRSSASHPADPHGRLAQKTVYRVPLLGVGGYDTSCTAVCNRCVSPPLVCCVICSQLLSLELALCS